ncbi:MAG: T9SS type A sorting domain-containing protein [Ignavibacteria bacterium]|nr:T9SS type A sorting domain-containing protein [Ignavibacteria bacterium]
MTSFSCCKQNGKVVLNWQTTTEVKNYGFEIERTAVNTGHGAKALQVAPTLQWEKIGFVQGQGNSNSVKVYSFTDKSAISGLYVYRLKQIDNDGKYEYSGVVEVNIDAPTKFELTQNYPNPFNPSTVISWQVPAGSYVSLKVYDVLGKEVATLVNEELKAGSYSVDFNASHLASGIYFYSIKAGNFIQSKKMILMK